MESNERLDLFDILIGIVLVSVILLSPLPFGSAAPWAKSAVFLLALVMAGLWLLQAARRGRIVLCRSPLWIVLPLAGACIALQLIPMAPDLLKSISPGTAALYGTCLPDWPGGGEARTLSLDPHATLSMVCHFGALALILVVVMNTVRTRGQVVALILALVAVGTFEVLYGFAEQFSGHRYIFWNERMHHLPAVTGTFHNKNHFAGLLEMIVPVALGLFIAASPRPARSPLMRARVLHTISEAGTYRQLMIGACLVLMTVGIFFSLSRAGILCSVCSWAGFALVLSMAAGFRKYTVALLLIVLITLCLAIGMGAGLVIDGIEDAASGKATSWADRLDLWKSSLSLFETFPLLGTGLGTFGAAFERFQSMRFGDRYADYLHNDWLQVFCEMGLLGGLAVALGILFIACGLFRATLARRDSFCRWIGLGAMMGVFAMLLHSFFDYNLYKITSNGVLFAVILGLWHAAASLPRRGEDGGKRYLVIRIRPSGMRWAGACVLPVLLCWPAAWSVRTGMADIHLNRLLANPEFRGRVEDYHFLPAAAEAHDPGRCIAEARRLDPANPRYVFYEALHEVKRAERKIRSQAEATARDLLGKELESCDPAGFRQVAAAIEQGLQPAMAGECGVFLANAEKRFREAITRSPGIPHFHLNLAGVIARQGRPLDGIHEARLALWLSPAKPSVLFEAGKIFAAGGFESGSGEEGRAALDFAAGCFRRALRADPDYAERIYSLVQSAMGGKEALADVTPMTVSCYEKLIEKLWAFGQWEDVLSCLDVAMHLLGKAPIDRDTPPGVIPEGPGAGLEAEALAPGKIKEMLASISRRRCLVLGLLGRWSERRQEVSRYNQLLRECIASKVRRARALRENGRYDESFALFLEVLEEDWKNPDALIAAAELASLPRSIDLAPAFNDPLDLLFRLVLHSGALDAEALASVTEILDPLRLEKAEDLLLADLIRGAALILGGRAQEGLERLAHLAPRAEEIGEAWRQRHLVWYFQALALERMGDPAGAAGAYARVVEEVPTHLGALERLAELVGEGNLPAGPDLIHRLDALKPPIACQVSFGGKVDLLGFDLSKESGPESGGGEGWYLTYYWRFRDRMPEDYHPLVHFCDENFRTLFQDDHRPRFMDRPYPVDLPRSGEVVKEKRRLSDDPTRTHYLRIGISSASPVRAGPKYLTSDNGDWYFLARIRTGNNSSTF